MYGFFFFLLLLFILSEEQQRGRHRKEIFDLLVHLGLSQTEAWSQGSPCD